MKISIIAAIGEKRELGKNNKLLWHIPEDMARFKKLTTRHTVIMGRTTFESIGKPLPNRISIIVTRNIHYSTNYSSSSDNDRNEKLSMNSSHPAKQSSNNKIVITHSLDEAIKIAQSLDKQEIFIIGGGQIYNQSIDIADKLYLTIVKGEFEADTYFPDYSEFKTIIKKQELDTPKYHLTFLELEK